MLAGLSRAVARRMVESGEVTVDGAAVEPKARVRIGSAIQVPPVAEIVRLVAEDVAFDVAFEDEHLIVVDKRAGLVVHPGAGHRSGTLAAGLLYRFPELEGVGDADRWGIIHRLDRDTSGVLLVARTPEVHDALRSALAARNIARVYHSIVVGTFDIPTGTIDAPIGRHPRHPTRMAVRRSGRSARTHYRKLAEWEGPDVSLLEVSLETGRTHQIRVHLESIGHPVVGDRTYGRNAGQAADAGRVWLHAARVTLHHPHSGDEMTVTSPLHDDLRASLDRLGEPTGGEVVLD